MSCADGGFAYLSHHLVSHRIKRYRPDSNVEMTWRVFGGQHADLYMELLKVRLFRDGIPYDDETLARQFRLHLHRGISYLAANRNLRKIDDLISLAVDSA